ncbi:hypothetical protein DFH09DRAFT_1393272 [Mycena vulgaris]|nr:hypothetical protein DFH09DRAFT_1393272 [Mycena vulgaris]
MIVSLPTWESSWRDHSWVPCTSLCTAPSGKLLPHPNQACRPAWRAAVAAPWTSDNDACHRRPRFDDASIPHLIRNTTDSTDTAKYYTARSHLLGMKRRVPGIEVSSNEIITTSIRHIAPALDRIHEGQFRRNLAGTRTAMGTAAFAALDKTQDNNIAQLGRERPPRNPDTRADPAPMRCGMQLCNNPGPLFASAKTRPNSAHETAIPVYDNTDASRLHSQKLSKKSSTAGNETGRGRREEVDCVQKMME